jgi:hypothetical protein
MDGVPRNGHAATLHSLFDCAVAAKRPPGSASLALVFHRYPGFRASYEASAGLPQIALPCRRWATTRYCRTCSPAEAEALTLMAIAGGFLRHCRPQFAGSFNGFPQIQGTQDEPGISQFRRLWATRIDKIRSTTISNIDLIHSRLFITASRPLWRNPARDDLVTDSSLVLAQ